VNIKVQHIFCDRLDEVSALIRNVENGMNTTHILIRRMGKTGTIYHLFHQLMEKKMIKCIYTDLFATQSIKDLTGQVAAAIFSAFPEKKSAGKKFMKILKSLSPVIKYDLLSGQPEIHFEYTRPKQYEHSLATLMTFLDEQNTPVLFAIDEFQQVAGYPEKNTEALLRTIVQQLKNVVFIFSESNKHLMNEIFNSQKRPFFASTQILHMGAIQSEKYLPFIREKFEEAGRNIQEEALTFIAEWTRLHTWYTQVLCNHLFASKIRNIDKTVVKMHADIILKEAEGTFFQYRNLLTPAQWQFLKAVAGEGRLYQPSSKEFLGKYQLSSPGNIPRLLQSLFSKEMIYRAEDENGQSYFSVYDCFLSRWLKKLPLK